MSSFEHGLKDLNTDDILPQLHTPTFVRSSSAFLFSAIITVSLRLQNSPLYPASLKFSKHLFGQSTEHSVCSLEFVQACALLCFWADAVDPGVATRLGYAIRWAFEQPRPRVTGLLGQGVEVLEDLTSC